MFGTSICALPAHGHWLPHQLPKHLWDDGATSSTGLQANCQRPSRDRIGVEGRNCSDQRWLPSTVHIAHFDLVTLLEMQILIGFQRLWQGGTADCKTAEFGSDPPGSLPQSKKWLSQRL